LRGDQVINAAAALEIVRDAAQGSVILAMLPDTGERYLSTFLFEGVNEDRMTSGWPRWAETWRGKRESGIGILLVSHSRWRTRKGIRERAWLSFVPFMVRQAHHER
jgi:hypothetical protein